MKILQTIAYISVIISVTSIYYEVRKIMEEMNTADEIIINTTSTVMENSCCLGIVEKIKNLTSFSFKDVFADEKIATDACCEIGLLPKRDDKRKIPCPKCGGITRALTNKNSKVNFTYRCCKRIKYDKNSESENIGLKRKNMRCCGYVSPLNNTFFEGVYISTLQVLRLIYCWVIRLPVTSAVLEAQVSTKTGVYFYCLFREIAEIIISNSEYQIGGPGLHVKVDEKYTWKKKYNRERITKEDQIIFGIYCKETTQGIFWHVENNNRRVLWSHLLKYIAKDSIIMSNAVPKSKGGKLLGFEDYKIINHSSLVKAKSINKKSLKINRKNKASQNRYVKMIKRSLRSDRTLQHYMSEYTYRSKVLSKLKTHGQRYYQFLEDIKKVYPGPNEIGITLKTIGINVETMIEEPYFDIEIKGHEETIKEDIIQIQDSQNNIACIVK